MLWKTHEYGSLQRIKYSHPMKSIASKSAGLFIVLSVQYLNGFVDVFFVGHYVPQAQSSVMTANILLVLISSLLATLVNPAQALCGRCLGSADYHAAGGALQNALVISAFVGIILSISTLLFSQLLSGWYTIDEYASVVMGTYLEYRSPSLLVSSVLFTFVGFFNASRDVRFLLLLIMFSFAVNILLNYLLLSGIPPFTSMGVKGAAIATTLASLCALIAAIAYVATNKKFRQYAIFDWRADKNGITKSSQIAWPAVLSATGNRGSIFVFLALVAQLTPSLISFFNATIFLLNLLAVPGRSIAMACSAESTRHLGYKNSQEAHNLALKGLWGIFVVTLICIFLVWVSSSFLSKELFTLSAEREQFTKLFWIILLAALPFSFVTFITYFLRGVGSPKWVLKTEVVVQWFIWLPATIFLVMLVSNSEMAVLSAFIIHLYLMAFLMFLHIKTQMWIKKTEILEH